MTDEVAAIAVKLKMLRQINENCTLGEFQPFGNKKIYKYSHAQ